MNLKVFFVSPARVVAARAKLFFTLVSLPAYVWVFTVSPSK